VAEVSIPMHLEGEAIWTPIILQGLIETMMWSDGFGIGRQDLYVGSLTEAHRGWRTRVDEFPDSVKAYLLLGTYIRDTYGTRHYGKAVNVSRRLRAAYDAALTGCDLLMMPTVPVKAMPMPDARASRTEYLHAAHGLSVNTASFNVTHHPAMSVPCGMAEGLPIGMMLIGKHFDEATIYRAAYAFEQAGDWRRM
jgi:amidase